MKKMIRIHIIFTKYIMMKMDQLKDGLNQLIGTNASLTSNRSDVEINDYNFSNEKL